MKTKMPFDTETERKVVKFMSWRQSLYVLIGGLIYFTIASDILFAGFNFIVTIIILALLTPITAPFLILAFYKNKETHYFFDRYLLFKINHSKKQAGIWRK